MIKYTIEEIFEHIKDLYNNLKIVKSILPYVGNSILNNNYYDTPPFYKNTNFMVHVTFDQIFNKDRIIKLRDAADSVNQGFIVRLYAYLDHCNIYKPCIDKKLNGHCHLKILKDLRNIFAHEMGHFDLENPDHLDLFTRMKTKFKLQEDITKIRLFPIPIDSVLLPLINGCKQYIQSLNDNQNCIILRSNNLNHPSLEEQFVTVQNYKYKIVSIPQINKEIITDELKKYICEEFCELIYSNYVLLEKKESKENHRFLKAVEKLRKTYFKDSNNNYQFLYAFNSNDKTDNKKSGNNTLKLMPIKNLDKY